MLTYTNERADLEDINQEILWIELKRDFASSDL